MKKKLLIIFTLLIILFTNKIILSKVILISLEKWINKDIIVKNFNIFYKKGEIHLNDVYILDKKNFEASLFESKKIKIKIEPSSLFTKLIIIKEVKIIKPTLNLKFDISKEDQKSVEDNLGLSDNLKNKDNPKIYPKKIVDINFLVFNSSIEDFKINIRTSNNNKIQTIHLSNMYFKNFGNELGYQHYKDVFKIILIDLIMKITDNKLREIIKKNYSFN